jgi:hypothetical protein
MIRTILYSSRFDGNPRKGATPILSSEDITTLASLRARLIPIAWAYLSVVGSLFTTSAVTSALEAACTNYHSINSKTRTGRLPCPQMRQHSNQTYHSSKSPFQVQYKRTPACSDRLFHKISAPHQRTGERVLVQFALRAGVPIFSDRSKRRV